MVIRKIDERLSVSPQIALGDMPLLRSQGFKSIISNRPDGEAADQPSYREIEQAAQAEGLEARHLPAVSGKITDQDAQAFGAALEALPGPVLAFCRTGTRSATLWALSQAGKQPLPEILERTQAAGYDMSGVIQRIANGGKVATNSPLHGHKS